MSKAEMEPLELDMTDFSESDHQSVFNQPLHSTPRALEQSIEKISNMDLFFANKEGSHAFDKLLSLSTIRASKTVSLLGLYSRRDSIETKTSTYEYRHLKILGNSCLKRCTSISPQSSQDSGLNTGNSSTPSTLCQDLANFVIDVVKHAQKVNDEMKMIKDENNSLKNRLSVTTCFKCNEAKVNEEKHIEFIKHLQSQQVEMSQKVELLQTHLIEVLKSKEEYCKYSQMWFKKYHEAVNENEALRNKNCSLNSKLSELRSKYSLAETDLKNLKEAQAKQDLPTGFANVVRNSRKQQLNLDIGTLKMLIERQMEIVASMEKTLKEDPPVSSRGQHIERLIHVPNDIVNESSLTIDCTTCDDVIEEGPLSSSSNTTSSSTTFLSECTPSSNRQSNAFQAWSVDRGEWHSRKTLASVSELSPGSSLFCGDKGRLSSSFGEISSWSSTRTNSTNNIDEAYRNSVLEDNSVSTYKSFKTKVDLYIQSAEGQETTGNNKR